MSTGRHTATTPCFLVSLPRSGSTLLQRLLAAHPAIATSGEPWLLFPMMYALRDAGVRAEFGHHSMVTGIREFSAGLPDGEADFVREMAGAARRLYTLHARGAGYFLDKTPRYYLFLAELATAFPDAKFLALLRNPLAVVASVLRTWKGGRFRLKSNAMDLYDGPGAIAGFLRDAHPGTLMVRYEDLVTDPARELGRITRHLGLDPLGDTELAEHDPVSAATLGDPTGIHRYDRVSTGSLESWPDMFASPVRRAWARRYLHHLGPETLALLGYPPETLLEMLARSGNSAPLLLRDVVDFNWRMVPNLLRPRTRFVRASRPQASRRRYRFSP